MKATLAILLLLCSLTGKATVCVDRFYIEEHVNLYLCQNHTSYNESVSLLFKARAQVLNGYIAEKVRNGELEDKKFEISIYDQVLTYTHLELSQGKNGYFVSMSGYPTLNELVAIVDYFANPDWQPFFTADYQQVSIDVIAGQIERFYRRHNSSGVTAYSPVTVWESGEIRLTYAGDSLRYSIGGQSVAFSVSGLLPAKVQNRYLFFEERTITVVEDGKTVKTFGLKEPLWGVHEVYTYPKWVNIHSWESGGWAYSYSYDKNRLYVRKE